MELDASLTPDEVKREHQKALTDFMEARQATLTVNLAGMVGMCAAHEAATRFKIAKANRMKWAHRDAGL